MIKAYYTFLLIFNKENGFIRNKLAIFKKKSVDLLSGPAASPNIGGD